MKTKGSLLSRLAMVNILIVVAAVVASGVGVRQFAHTVIINGDMMTMDKLPDFLRQTQSYLIGVIVVTALVAALAAWYLFRQIMQPLTRIEQMSARVAGGDYSARLNEQGSDELGRLAGAMDRMTESLAQVEGLRRDLVANVAHELRTPLTAAQGLLHAMRDGLIPADEKHVEQIAEEVARLIRLVEALHQLSLSDVVPPGGLHCEPLELGDLVRDVAGGMMPLFEQKGLQVTVGQQGAAVRGNQDALVQVLVNLMDNAAKHSPEGGWVRIMVEPGGQVVITNSGPTILPNDLARLFERFYRVERSRSRETGGAGIGLAIVQNLVAAQGGRIWVKSEEGATSFRLALPLVK